MKNVCVFLIGICVLTFGLFAGDNLPIKEGDEYFKKLKLSVVQKMSESNPEKLIFMINVHGKGIGEVYLFHQNKNTELKPLLKEEMATFTFEVDKNKLEKSRFYFAYPNGSNCPPSYALELSEYIKNK